MFRKTYRSHLHSNFSQPIIDPKVSDIAIEDDNDDDDEEKNSNGNQLELHKLLKDSLKNDDLQDTLISKLCEIER